MPEELHILSVSGEPQLPEAVRRHATATSCHGMTIYVHSFV